MCFLVHYGAVHIKPAPGLQQATPLQQANCTSECVIPIQDKNTTPTLLFHFHEA